MEGGRGSMLNGVQKPKGISFFPILRTLSASVTYSFEFLILQVVRILSTSLFNDWLNKMHSAKRVPISLWEETKKNFF